MESEAAGWLSRAYDSWSQDHEFEPTLGIELILKNKERLLKKKKANGKRSKAILKIKKQNRNVLYSIWKTY